MEQKRYYWLKLQHDFFRSKRIKKMRKLPHGDTLVIIYLKLQLLTLTTGGVFEYARVDDSIEAELALDLDESEEDVTMALQFLLDQGLCECFDDGSTYSLPYVSVNTGSETASSQRVRDYRQRHKDD